MSQRVVVKERYKDRLVIREAARDEWIREYVNRHCVVIKAEQLIESYLFPLNLAPFPLLLSEYSHPELTIIKKAASELLAGRVLDALLDLDVSLVVSNLLLEGKLLSLDTKLCNIGCFIILRCDHDGSLRVIRYDHVLDRVPSDHLVLF